MWTTITYFSYFSLKLTQHYWKKKAEILPLNEVGLVSPQLQEHEGFDL